MFGERLQQLRSQRDMKQAVLAKRLGVSRSAINAWENGISFPWLFRRALCGHQRPYAQPAGNGGAADTLL